MRSSLFALVVVVALPAGAASLLPAPPDDAVLAERARRYDRQFHGVSAFPFGLSLDAEIPDEGHRALVDAFVAASGPADFLAFTTAQGTPLDPDDVVVLWGEHGDIGMFAGLPAAADAWRYLVLRDGGAPTGEVDTARDDLLDAIDAFHVVAAISGTPGGVARGIRRAGDVGDANVPFPSTCPDPWNRPDTWRGDPSGLYPEWEMVDDVSKDQLLGYVLALGAFHDAVSGDDTFAASVKEGIVSDALALARLLMEPVDVGADELVDLVIRDVDGCLVQHHDLNPRLVPRSDGPPLLLAADSNSQNAFNAAASLGIIRTLYHVTRDAEVGAFYYDVLVGERGYPALLTTGIASLGAMYVDFCLFGDCYVTNFSNVNMAFVAMFGVLRYETDAALLATYRQALDDELWDNDRPHDGRMIGQALFNLMYAGFKSGGVDEESRAEAAVQLRSFPLPPYWNSAVENCDASELAAGSCLAVDGVTVLTLNDNPDRGGSPVAEGPVPRALRPPSDFEWRSDPRRVNGGGGARLNPGGDFRGAYWLGRLLLATSDNDENLSPHRVPYPPPAAEPDAGQPGVDDGGALPLDDAGAVTTGDAGGAPTADDAGPLPPLEDAGPLPDGGHAPDGGTTELPEGCSCGGARSFTSSLPWLLVGAACWRARRRR